MQLEHTLLVITATVVLTALATIALQPVPPPDYCPEVKVAIDAMYNCMADPSCVSKTADYEQLIKNNLYIQGNCTDERKASEVTPQGTRTEKAH